MIKKIQISPIKRLFLCGCLRKPRIHKILIRNPRVKLTGFLQNVLEKLKAFLLKDRIFFPGILLFVAVHDDRDLFGVGLLKLRTYRLGDLLGGVGVHIVEAFLNRICEFLDDLRMLFNIAFFCTVGRVRDVAGVFSEGRDYIAVSFLFQGCGEGFELDGVI